MLASVFSVLTDALAGAGSLAEALLMELTTPGTGLASSDIEELAVAGVATLVDAGAEEDTSVMSNSMAPSTDRRRRPSNNKRQHVFSC